MLIVPLTFSDYARQSGQREAQSGPAEPIASALAQPKMASAPFNETTLLMSVFAFFSLFQTRSARQVAQLYICTATALAVQQQP
jgi:hypothetical protein